MSGFKDPADKFPDKSALHKQNTSISANADGRNVATEGTPIFKRLQTRAKGVPITHCILSDDVEYFAEPIPAYNAEYPYNKVFQTESGHIQEFDDTPGNERINRQHRSGTYEEIDAKGSRALKIIGDDYEIYTRNSFIHIKGARVLTIDGTSHVLILGDTFMENHGNMYLKQRGDMFAEVSGKIDLKAQEDILLESVDGSIKVKAKKNFSVEVGEDISLRGEGNGLWEMMGNIDERAARIDLNTSEPGFTFEETEDLDAKIQNDFVPLTPYETDNLSTYLQNYFAANGISESDA